MCLACYGGSYIPALSASCISPLSVVLLRLLISFWVVSCVCCVFLLYFELFVLTNMSGKGLIYGVVGVEMTESQLAAAMHKVCTVHCNVCTVSCLHRAAPYALWGPLRTLSAAAYGELMKARSCHHLRRNLWAFLVLMGWWF